MMRTLRNWWNNREQRKEDGDLRFDVKELSRAVQSKNERIADLETEVFNLSNKVRTLEAEAILWQKEIDILSLHHEKHCHRLREEAGIREQE